MPPHTGPENGNADSPLNETERYNLTNRTQPRILGLAARGEAFGEWGGLTLVLTPIVQPNIYFSYVNVLETFIILILGPNSERGLRGWALPSPQLGSKEGGRDGGGGWNRPGNTAQKWVRVMDFPMSCSLSVSLPILAPGALGLPVCLLDFRPKDSGMRLNELS